MSERGTFEEAQMTAGRQHSPREEAAGATDETGQARKTAQAFLSGMSPAPGPRDVDAVLLVVSELVTNAVRHAGGVCQLRLRAVGGDAVEIEVSDRSPDRPRSRPLDPQTPGGFGLHLVHALSRTVTVHPGHGGGKTIRALIPCTRAMSPARPTRPAPPRAAATGPRRTARRRLAS